MVAEGGLGPAIFPEFEKVCGCHVRAVSSGDATQILNRLEIDAKRGVSGAQVVLGLDEQLWARAKGYLEDWGDWRPQGWERIAPQISGMQGAPGSPGAKTPAGFLPFDYGVFAFMADESALAAAGLKAPTSLAELTDPKWRKKLLLEDPRTSGPGLAFLLYALETQGPTFLKAFAGQWLTLAPGWDGAYQLFLKKEAPLVWSYTTSQAYHEEHGEKVYRALIFSEGQPFQMEGAAWVRGGVKSERDRERAKRFFEFLLSPKVQELIPRKNYMFPAVEGTKLPESFKKLPKPSKRVPIARDAVEIDTALKDWESGLRHLY
jgi:thiamine transport system substrate-binding protein